MGIYGIRFKINNKKGNIAKKKLYEMALARYVRVPFIIPTIYNSSKSYKEKAFLAKRIFFRNPTKCLMIGRFCILSFNVISSLVLRGGIYVFSRFSLFESLFNYSYQPIREYRTQKAQ